MSRYKFFDGIKKLETLPPDNLQELVISNLDIQYEIPKSEEYRPDLIANRFYGKPELFWVLVYANKFSNSPEDFYVTRIIRIPHYKKVVQNL